MSLNNILYPVKKKAVSRFLHPIPIPPNGPGIDDVLHGIAGRHALGLRDLPDALGPEGALGIDVDHLQGKKWSICRIHIRFFYIHRWVNRMYPYVYIYISIYYSYLISDGYFRYKHSVEWDQWNDRTSVGMNDWSLVALLEPMEWMRFRIFIHPPVTIPIIHWWNWTKSSDINGWISFMVVRWNDYCWIHCNGGLI